MTVEFTSVSLLSRALGSGHLSLQRPVTTTTFGEREGESVRARERTSARERIYQERYSYDNGREERAEWATRGNERGIGGDTAALPRYRVLATALLSLSCAVDVGDTWFASPSLSSTARALSLSLFSLETLIRLHP